MNIRKIIKYLIIILVVLVIIFLIFEVREFVTDIIKDLKYGCWNLPEIEFK